MKLILIVNSVVCVLGTLGGLLFALASIISIANMKVPWANLLIGAAFLVPLAFVISGIGVWVAQAHGPTWGVAFFVALPWVYSVIFVLVMLKSF